MKILCFGDSNTYGYDPRSYFGSRYPAEHRWVDLLAQKLDCTVVNAGENGREIPRRQEELQPGFLKGISGTYRDPEGYFVKGEDVECFDRTFPPKEKLRLPGQLV